MKVMTLTVSVAALLFGAAGAVAADSVAERKAKILQQRELLKGAKVSDDRRGSLLLEKPDAQPKVSNNTGTRNTGTRVVSDPPRQRTQTVAANIDYPFYPDISSDRRITDQVKFRKDSSFLEPESQEIVRRSCQAILELDAETETGSLFKYVIYGHTDASGSDQYNYDLSVDRAKAVKRFMQEDEACSIAAYRLEAKGMGESRLLDGLNENAPTHRRVELVLGS